MKIIKTIVRWIWKIIKWCFLVIILLAAISAVYNTTLPETSEVTEVLSESQKIYISEAFNLQQGLGNDLWADWGNTKIPVIVYNEDYAFLIGYEDPPAGWHKMPSHEFRGTEWGKVENDDFFGSEYYRQLLPNKNITPENFTVKVGDTWVATMQTKEYAAVMFYKDFRESLPPVISSIFPYSIFWNLVMGQAEQYIAGLMHESFHAFQGTIVPEKLARGELATHISDQYPWHQQDNINGWKKETNLLLKAYYSDNIDSVSHYTAEFLTARQMRRQKAGITAEQIGYEKKREWLEGLAKYAELKILLLAGKDADYQPVKETARLSDFKKYKKSSKLFFRQLDEVKRAAGRPGESRFYYVGMLQAMVLDKIAPGWKSSAFDDDIFLDDLLILAIS